MPLKPELSENIFDVMSEKKIHQQLFIKGPLRGAQSNYHITTNMSNQVIAPNFVNLYLLYICLSWEVINKNDRSISNFEFTLIFMFLSWYYDLNNCDVALSQLCTGWCGVTYSSLLLCCDLVYSDPLKYLITPIWILVCFWNHL